MSHHRTSPHLSHLDPHHHSSTPSTPSPPYPLYAQPIMSGHPQPNASQSRQPTSYPSPHSYPSPSMSAYAYPPPQQQQPQQQPVEPYRASPTGSHVSLPSLNLPPIRHTLNNDPRNPQPPGQAPMGSPLPPPGAPMPGYYPQSLPAPPHAMNVTSSPHHQAPLRYPLPQPDGRIMSGGRHKKEIKRRTKTGCLTCRKRRIKCDEAHPTCRNCQKSKRECLGYDPIFKSQPGPPAIQPAPTSANPGSMTSSAPYPPPGAYVPAVAGQYPPALSATGSSPASSVEPYDYSSAIDPALEAAGPIPTTGYDGAPGVRPDLKRGLETGSPYSPDASDAQNPKAKRMKIDDLLAIGGAVLPPLTPPSENAAAAAAAALTPAALDEIKRFYSDHYAPAMDDFLEVRWFSARGLPWLLNDTKLCEQMASLMERFRTVYTAADVDAFPITQALELRCIWSLLGLCRVAGAANKTAATGNSEYDQKDAQASGVNEAARRLSIFEDLVSGAVVETNLADLARIGSVQHDHAKLRELEFWRLIGKFLTLRDDEASAAKEIDDALAGCRTLLDSRENRDVIYSIAIARHIGQRVAEFPASVADAASADEEDAKAKLAVAKQFIESEAAGRGTTLVIQRLCAMATRAWQAAPATASTKDEAATTNNNTNAATDAVTDPALK